MTTALVPPSCAVFRLCRTLIAGAARLVPSAARADWRLEWEAEVWHRVATLTARDRLTLRCQAQLLTRCLGAFRHTAWIRARALRTASRSLDPAAALADLRATPVQTGGTVLLLALTLGVTGAVFGIAQTLRNGPAPGDPSSRTIRIWNATRLPGNTRFALSLPEVETYAADSRTLERLAGLRIFRAAAAGGGAPAVVAVGRGLRPADFAPGAEPVAILGDEIWRGRYGGEAGVLGRTVRVGGVERRIVGIAPPGAGLPGHTPMVWILIERSAGAVPVGERSLRVVGRLRAGMSREAAETELTALSRRLQRRHPEAFFGPANDSWRIVSAPLAAASPADAPVLLLVSAAASVLAAAGALGGAVLLALRSRARSGAMLPALLLAGGAGMLAVLLIQAGYLALGPLLEEWFPAAAAPRLGAPVLTLLAAASLAAPAPAPAIARRPGPGAVALSLAAATILLALALDLSRRHRGLLAIRVSTRRGWSRSRSSPGRRRRRWPRGSSGSRRWTV